MMTGTATIQTERRYVGPDFMVEVVICRSCGEDLGPLEHDPELQYEQVTPTGSCWPCAMGAPPHPDYDEDPEPDEREIASYELEARLADPCPECGAAGACSFDDEGRPLIHATGADD
jgi:hypothetical protein